jgi:hypothetical protein
LMGDNCSENKNNDLFGFCSDLVARGWFDKISVVFGPVGHTHNGNDAIHYCHNQLVGNSFCVTLPEYIKAFERTWTNKATRPTGVVLDTQYDWRAVYKPVLQRVEGFTKTKKNEFPARAYKFERDETGVVTMQYKADPTHEHWLGLDGQRNGPGFVCLPRLPDRPPAEVSPEDCRMLSGDLSSLQNDLIMQACKDQGKGSNMKWVLECARTGRVQTLGRTADIDSVQRQPFVEDRAVWGPLERMGVPSASMDVPVIRRTTYAENLDSFWQLPADLVAEQQHVELSIQRIRTAATRHIPAVRYVRPSATATCVSDSEDEDNRPLRRDPPSRLATASMVYKTTLKRIRQEAEDASTGMDNTEDGTDDGGPEVVQWGADWSTCRPGVYAAVKMRWSLDKQSSKGIEVVQVSSVAKNEGTFNGRRLVCAEVQHDKACITAKWRLSTKKDVLENLSKTSVISYFCKLNLHPPSLPVGVRDILEQNADTLFGVKDT